MPFIRVGPGPGGFFWYIPPVLLGDNATIKGTDMCSFLSDALPVAPRHTGRFSRDLTSQDDLILAVLSLVLLLLLQGVLTTLLLRTRGGAVGAASFAVKQAVELAREYRLRVPRARARAGRGGVALVAAVVVAASFGLEVGILALTAPRERVIRSDDAAVELEHPWNPRWDLVRYHHRASVNRACVAISLTGVEQGATRVSACVSSNLSARVALFERASEETDAEIRSDLHEFGAEHFVRFGDFAGRFSTRGYYALWDGRERLLRQQGRFYLRRRRAAVLHRQLLALLFNQYKREQTDSSLGLDALNELNISATTESACPPVTVLPGVAVSDCRRLTTAVRGVMPGGEAPVRFAQAVFKDAAAVRVTTRWGADGLFVGEGEQRAVAGVWAERVRLLNVVGLGVAVGAAAAVLCVLRAVLRPASMAEMAARGVADDGRVGGERKYLVGAEVDDWQEEEYGAGGRYGAGG